MRDEMRQDHDEIVALGETIAETAATIDAATQRFLTHLRAFDEAGGWQRAGALSCAHWLSWRVGMDLGAAREKVRVARKLAELPAIDKAMADGTISYSKVRAMTRVATARNEAELLTMASPRSAAASTGAPPTRQHRSPVPRAAVGQRLAPGLAAPAHGAVRREKPRDRRGSQRPRAPRLSQRRNATKSAGRGLAKRIESPVAGWGISIEAAWRAWRGSCRRRRRSSVMPWAQ